MTRRGGSVGVGRSVGWYVLSRSMRFRHHVFVCVHCRPDRGRPSCGARGSDEIVTELNLRVLARGLAGDVAVTTSGCLGPCFEGPNVVVYL